MTLKRVIVFALVIAMMAAMFAGCAKKQEAPKEEKPSSEEAAKEEKPAEKTYKVAMVLPGPISDAGWNANAYKGLMEAKDKYGVEVAFSENVPMSDYEETFRDYASKGFDLVIGNGFEFGEICMKVADDFPNTFFAAINGDVTNNKNVVGLQYKHWQVGYIAGVLAAMMSKSGVIGFVGGWEIPSVSEPEAQYKRAAKEINPNIKVLSAYTGSWEDVAKGKELALAQINNGADVIFHCADAAGTGAIQAAAEKGVWAIGEAGDQSAIAPDTVLTSVLQESPKLIDRVVGMLLDGTLEAKVYQLGVAEGVQGIAPFNKAVPQEVRDKIKQVIDDLVAGKIKEK